MKLPEDLIGRALLVEDDTSLRRLLASELEDYGLDVRAVASAEEAASELASWSPDIVVSDLRLPHSNGLELLGLSAVRDPAPAFVVITAFGTIPQAVEALKAGADDFLTKPVDFERLRLSVQRALERRRLVRQVRQFQSLLSDNGFHGLIGRSRPMLRLFAQIEQVARGAGPVLIQGESGVGKELAAKAVHQCSDRAQGPFLAVNCAGLPEALMESELFGHAAGAFTGAERTRKGLFSQAVGGTLLLDEVGELSLTMQAKLLRAIQEGKVRPVGSDRERPVDIRLIAASNSDLEQEAARGRFRDDLFYRLETFTIQVPPLREREDDLELLAARFLERFAARLGKEVRGFSAKALERLTRYPFPGNVRELQNAVERAATLCHGTLIQPEDLPARIRSFVPSPRVNGGEGLPPNLFQDDLLPSLSEIESRYIHYVLDRVGGNKRRAAALLGVSRATLYRRLGEADAGGSES